MFLLRGHYASPIDYDDEALEQARRPRRDAAEPAARRRRRKGRGAAAGRVARRWTRTSTRRGRWRCCSTRRPRRRARWRRCWTCWGWAGWRARSRRRPSCWSKARERDAARAERRLRAGRCGARRDRGGRLGGARHRRAARCSTAAMTAEVVYGTHPVREALRGRREVLRVWCTRPGGARGGVAAGRMRGRVPAERLAELAGSERPPGAGGRGGAVPVRRSQISCWSEIGALLVALDEVTDPHNLGAVARVCEGAGADGLLITRRRSAAVTAAVCRASAGAVEHLADRAGREPGGHADPGAAAGAVELRRGRGGRPARTTATTTATARCSCWERRGGDCGRACRDSCDAAATIPMRGRVESLNVGTAAAVLLFEAVRQRRGG